MIFLSTPLAKRLEEPKKRSISTEYRKAENTFEGKSRFLSVWAR